MGRVTLYLLSACMVTVRDFRGFEQQQSRRSERTVESVFWSTQMVHNQLLALNIISLTWRDLIASG